LIKKMGEIEKYNQIAALEAILFTYGEPISIKEIAKRLNLNETDCYNLVEKYNFELNNDAKRGLMLLWNNNCIQLATKPDFQNLIQDFIKEEFRETLTPAALETLAIVAYLGPVPRSIIDQIRGVNSSFILRSLLVRGLIEKSTNPEHSNIYYYDLSSDALKHFGVSKKEELPDYQNYKDILDKFTVEQTNTE